MRTRVRIWRALVAGAYVFAAGTTAAVASDRQQQATHTVVLGDEGGADARTRSWAPSDFGPSGWAAGDGETKIELPHRANGWVQLQNGRQVLSFRSLGLELGNGNRLSPAPVPGVTEATDESEVVYRAVYPAVDERFRITSRGLKHDMVLNVLPSWLGGATGGDLVLTWEMQLTPELAVEAEGTTIVDTTTRTRGGLLVRDAVGRAPFYVSAARVFESSSGGVGVHHTSSTSAEIEVAMLSPGNYRLSVIVSRAWLIDPARQYPITIDPTVVVNPLGLTHTGFVTWDTGAFYDRLDDEIATGTLQGAFSWMVESHGFARFDVSSIPDCATITAVEFESWTANHDDPLSLPPRIAVPLPMEIKGCPADPLSATNAALFNAVGGAPIYHAGVVPRTGTNFCLGAHQGMTYPLNATAIADLQAALASNYFVVGLTNEVVSFPLFDHIDHIGYTEVVNGACGLEPAPGSRVRLRVTYTECCGNGVVDPGEQCDDGNGSACDGCSATCQLECGNGVMDCAETCDDGNTAPCDGCSATCVIECGNGVAECAETCDDGNTTPCDGCSATCGVECGNGVTECAETCDDGNTAPCDGCSASCVLECGDGLQQCAETCDDGNTTSCDGCSATCSLECGNGVQECAETCDDGNTAPCDGCSATCVLECGDGVRQCAETCDDGNTAPCDGCSASCGLECGNGLVECAEQCDDGNLNDGDGCSSLCEIELVLAVTWLEVGARCQGDDVVVTWSVSEEDEMYGYQVVRRAGRGPWTAVAGPVWATGPYSIYSVVDDTPGGKDAEYVIQELCYAGVNCDVSPTVVVDCTTARRDARATRRH